MDSTITSALIAVGGVVLSLLVTIAFGIITNHYNYNQLFAQTVSDNRMDWINVWRENISKFLACAEFLHRHNDKNCEKSDECDKCYEYEKEMYQAKSMIISRLNLTENEHVFMKASLDNFDYNDDEKTFIVKREYILELARKILKPEWERVKQEAKGKRR